MNLVTFYLLKIWKIIEQVTQPSFLCFCLDTVYNMSDLFMGCNFYYHEELVVSYLFHWNLYWFILLCNLEMLYCCLVSTTAVDTWVMLKLACLEDYLTIYFLCIYKNICLSNILFLALFFVAADLFVGYLYLLHSCLGSMGVLARSQRSYRGGRSVVELILCLRMSNACSVWGIWVWLWIFVLS